MNSFPLDIQSDGSHSRLRNLVADGYIPEWVKAAAVTEIQPTEAVVDECFAHPERRLLPCHTKAATAVSAGYFYADPTLYPDRGYVEQRLLQKMAIFDVPIPSDPEGSPEPATIATWAYENGEDRACPVSDAATFDRAVRYFYQYRPTMLKAAADRMAHRLVRSPYFDAATPHVRAGLMKAARLGYGSVDLVREFVDTYYGDEHLDKLPKMSKKANFYGPKELVQVDQLLYRLQPELGGLPDSYVEHTLDDVQAARFEEHVKQANDLDVDAYLDRYGDKAAARIFDDLLAAR